MARTMDHDLDLHGSIALRLSDNVAELRLTRPDRSNCVSRDQVEDLHAIVEELDGRDDVYAIALTHEGSTFCAGYDLDVIMGDDPDERSFITSGHNAGRSWLHNAPIPVVVGVSGAAAAAGAGFAEVGDVIVAGPEFRIWWPEINVGVFPQTMGPNFVDRYGYRRAAEITLLGEHAKFGPEEAREMGIVNRIVDDGEVDTTAVGLAETMAEHERAYGTMLDAYELLVQAKQEERHTTNGAFATAQWHSTYDDWFAEGERITNRDDPR